MNHVLKYFTLYLNTYYYIDIFLDICNAQLEISPKFKKIQYGLISSTSEKRRLPIRECSVIKRRLDLDNQNIDSEPEEPFVDSGDKYFPSASSSDSMDVSITDNSPQNDKQEEMYNTIVNNANIEYDNKEYDQDYNRNKVVATTTKKNVKVKRMLVKEYSDDIISDEENVEKDEGSDRIKAVKIATIKKTSSGKRIRNKRHCCFICNKLLSNNMARHFELKHGNDV